VLCYHDVMFAKVDKAHEFRTFDPDFSKFPSSKELPIIMAAATNRLLSTIVVCLLAATSVFGQSNPTPFNLAGGNYSFTTWNTTEPALTYPVSMVFQTFTERLEGFGLDASAQSNGNWLGVYSLTSGTRVQGGAANGVLFTNTAAPAATSNCQSVGAALLALNTTGRADVRVQFLAGATTSGVARPYVLRLQYRLGTAGAWTTATDNVGNPVQYLYANVASTTTFNWTMPMQLENQPVVQLRWVYAQDGFGTGNRPTMRLDDIVVQSSPIASAPTALRIFQQIPLSPSQNLPFTLVVRSVDALGAPNNVTANTTVTLSVNTGTGTLGGTLTGTILAGTNSVTFSNVTYNTAQAGVSVRATASAGMALGFVNTSPFSVSAGAAYVLYENFENVGYVNTPANPWRVVAYRNDGTIDAGYSGAVTLSLLSGTASLLGTLTVNANQGVAEFTNVFFNTTGVKRIRITPAGLPILDMEQVEIRNQPSILSGSEVVPQFVPSSGGTCGSSAFAVPVFARVTLTGLLPNTTYRYVSGMAVDDNITSTGPGLNITYNGMTDVFAYSGGKNIATDGNYSTFSTGPSETSKAIWVNILISNNVVFQEGAILRWRITLGDHLGRLIRHLQISQTSTALRLGSALNQGTGVVDEHSQFAERNMVYLWDNTAGTGRPLVITIVQGLNTVSNFVETFYRNIENRPSAWAAFVPNNNAIRRIEERNRLTNAIVYNVISANGVFDGVNTANATGGFSSPIFLRTPRVVVNRPMANDSICTGSLVTINYNARGTGLVNIQYSTNDGLSWETIDQVTPGNVNSLTGESSYTWQIPGLEFNSQHRIRVISVSNAAVLGISGRFVVSAPLAIVEQPQSRDVCLDDNFQLVVLSSGSVRGYRWYKDGVALPNSNAAVFSVTDAHYGTSGVYQCEVMSIGACQSVWSQPAHIRVNTATNVVNQTRVVPVSIGGTAVMTIEVEAPANPTYQWYKGVTMLRDDGRVIGATSSRLEIRDVRNNDLGADYYCVLSGACGTTQSRTIRIFSSGIFIDAPTASVDACVGQTANVRADVYANPSGADLTIRWFRNGQPLSNGGKYDGVNTSTLVINNVAAGDAGVYTVRGEITGDASRFATANVNVAIASAPTITLQPADADACVGSDLTLSVAAAATGVVSYQWLFNGAPVAGATSANLTISNFTAARAGAYSVQTSTACGSTTSRAATVTAIPATTITTQPPATLDVQVGAALTIVVAATGPGTLQYQWFKDDAAIAGEVTPTYSKTNAELADAGRYWVRITSQCGNTFSDTTVVTTRPVVSSVTDAQFQDGSVVRAVVPNPVASSASIAVEFARAQHVVISVFDLTGRPLATVFEGMADSGSALFTIDASPLPSGTYVVGIATPTGRITRPFVVIR